MKGRKAPEGVTPEDGPFRLILRQLGHYERRAFLEGMALTLRGEFPVALDDTEGMRDWILSRAEAMRQQDQESRARYLAEIANPKTGMRRRKTAWRILSWLGKEPRKAAGKCKVILFQR